MGRDDHISPCFKNDEHEWILYRLPAPDGLKMKGDGSDLLFITLHLEDANGLPVPDADHLIQFEISGPGEIVATDNGNAADLIAFSSTQRKAFNGLALVIVRAKRGSKGPVIVTARSAGLKTANITLSFY
ncbi:hypothetical protein [uncultured Chitinophaga sp.]|uniref:hypothetical protein n=1 Tax=uncultured Chitinophaga sp. TaxID=339340 RepID=UPI0025EE5E4F|nr:hypothetical protein [uncultured Chitinophaga sp.]